MEKISKEEFIKAKEVILRYEEENKPKTKRIDVTYTGVINYEFEVPDHFTNSNLKNILKNDVSDFTNEYEITFLNLNKITDLIIDGDIIIESDDTIRI